MDTNIDPRGGHLTIDKGGRRRQKSGGGGQTGGDDDDDRHVAIVIY
jgi:hypothetical protein